MQKLNKSQSVLLFHLMFIEDVVPILSKFKPQVTKISAAQLEKMGLIKIERSGNTLKAREKSPFKNITLTDYAWEWFWDEENFASAKSSKPQAAEYALSRLFEKIRAAQKRDADFFCKFSELLNGESKQTGPREAIISAYLKASGGKFCELVAISDIRKNMPPEMKSSLNDILIQMQREKKLVLNVQGNPGALNEEDRINPVMVGGTPRHVVYMEEPE